MITRFRVHDAEGREHVVLQGPEGFRFPTYGNRLSGDLKGLVDVQEDPVCGPLGVVALLEGMGREVQILGPDWVEIWTALGFHEKVQQNLRVSYRLLNQVYPRLNAEHQVLARATMRDLWAKMAQESTIILSWEETCRRA